MKKVLLTLLMMLCCTMQATAQTVRDGSYRTVGYIKSDGTVQDGSYRTIGHADGISARYAAVLFFFGLFK